MGELPWYAGVIVALSTLLVATVRQKRKPVEAMRLITEALQRIEPMVMDVHKIIDRTGRNGVPLCYQRESFEEEFRGLREDLHKAIQQMQELAELLKERK